nr:zf-TFIIB domain-containing protein [Cystobacter ferrugineus]
MARPCPLCANESLRPLRVSLVEVGTCVQCHGLWFGRGAWARVPDRPPVRAFLAAARQAPSRCRKKGHLIPPERGTCATCGSTPPGLSGLWWAARPGGDARRPGGGLPSLRGTLVGRGRLRAAGGGDGSPSGSRRRGNDFHPDMLGMR